MKTSFSTLACPDFSWQDIYSMAKDFNFDGIEIRGLGDNIYSTKAAPFTDEELPKIEDQLVCYGDVVQNQMIQKKRGLHF